jgi:hypothetical protein
LAEHFLVGLSSYVFSERVVSALQHFCLPVDLALRIRQYQFGPSSALTLGFLMRWRSSLTFYRLYVDGAVQRQTISAYIGLAILLPQKSCIDRINPFVVC